MRAATRSTSWLSSKPIRRSEAPASPPTNELLCVNAVRKQRKAVIRSVSMWLRAAAAAIAVCSFECDSKDRNGVTNAGRIPKRLRSRHVEQAKLSSEMLVSTTRSAVLIVTESVRGFPESASSRATIAARRHLPESESFIAATRAGPASCPSALRTAPASRSVSSI